MRESENEWEREVEGFDIVGNLRRACTGKQIHNQHLILHFYYEKNVIILKIQKRKKEIKYEKKQTKLIRTRVKQGSLKYLTFYLSCTKHHLLKLLPGVNKISFMKFNHFE